MTDLTKREKVEAIAHGKPQERKSVISSHSKGLCIPAGKAS